MLDDETATVAEVSIIPFNQNRSGIFLGFLGLAGDGIMDPQSSGDIGELADISLQKFSIFVDGVIATELRTAFVEIDEEVNLV